MNESGAEIGRALAARRRLVKLRCESCGLEIEGARTRRFCTNACRMRAARQRTRDGTSVLLTAARSASTSHSPLIGQRKGFSMAYPVAIEPGDRDRLLRELSRQLDGAISQMKAIATTIDKILRSEPEG